MMMEIVIKIVRRYRMCVALVRLSASMLSAPSEPPPTRPERQISSPIRSKSSRVEPPRRPLFICATHDAQNPSHEQSRATFWPQTRLEGALQGILQHHVGLGMKQKVAWWNRLVPFSLFPSTRSHENPSREYTATTTPVQKNKCSHSTGV